MGKVLKMTWARKSKRKNPTVISFQRNPYKNSKLGTLPINKMTKYQRGNMLKNEHFKRYQYVQSHNWHNKTQES